MVQNPCGGVCAVGVQLDPIPDGLRGPCDYCHGPAFAGARVQGREWLVGECEATSNQFRFPIWKWVVITTGLRSQPGHEKDLLLSALTVTALIKLPLWQRYAYRARRQLYTCFGSTRRAAHDC